MSDLGNANWSPTDASNNANPPNGWPEGMNPSDVNNSARANMGAIKRWWQQVNAVVTSAGSTTAFTVDYAVASGALYDGEVVVFIADRDCVAAATLNKNSLAARAVVKFTAGAWAAVANGDWLAGQIVTVAYDLANTRWKLLAVSVNWADFVTLAGNNTYTGTNDFTGGRLKAPTRPVADNGTDAASTAFVNRALRGYLAGLTISNNSGTPNTKIDVAAGVCMDDGNASMLVLAATTLDCTTTGANGLDAGSLANSTWYHVHVIGKADGTTALLACTTANLGSITMPSGYTLKRRIGSFKTDGSAHIVTFVQDGDLFQWKAPVADISATNPGDTAVSRTLTVPTGIRLQALVQGILQQGDTAGVFAYLSDLSTNDVAAGSIGGGLITLGNAISNALPSATLPIYTNTSAQIRSRVNGSNANTILYINTLGWIDRRGRDA